MEQPANEIEQPVQKKEYEAPKLARYGDLVEVTLSNFGGSGAIDNLKGQNKTA